MPSSDIMPVEKQENTPSEEFLTLLENHQYEYSIAALAAQERDREAHRAHRLKTQKAALMFLIIMGVILLAALIAAFILGKDQLIIECVKYLAVFGGGSGAGYVWGFRRGRRSN